MKSKIIKYSVISAIGLMMSYIVMNNYGFFEAQDLAYRYRVLCDAFTIPGVIFIMCGALVWISQQGMFDTLSYAGKMVMDQFRREHEHTKYVDYVLEKRETRRQGGFAFMIITGLAFVAVSLVFFALFYLG